MNILPISDKAAAAWGGTRILVRPDAFVGWVGDAGEAAGILARAIGRD